MPMTLPLNLLPYAGATPQLLGPPAHAGAGHALIGRLDLGERAWLGAGSVIRADGHFVTAGADLHLGRGATVHIAHDVYPTQLGVGVTVGANAVVHACRVGDGAVIEDDAVVLDGAVVEPGAVIAAGSIVFGRNTAGAGWLHAGRPARPLRALAAEELAARRAAQRQRNEAAAHDWAAGAPRPADGNDIFIANTAVLHGAVELGPQASVWYGVRLDAADTAIHLGARSNVQDNSVLRAAEGAIHIGADTTIGHNVAMGPATIGDRCLIGIGSQLAPGTVAEDDVFLAAGAITEPGQVLGSGWLWGGQPARPLAELDERKRQLIAATIPTYCAYAAALTLAQRQAAEAAAR